MSLPDSIPPRPEIPYGYCQCGCGEKTKPARNNDPRYGIKKGDLQKFLLGHSRKRSWDPIIPKRNPDIPYGCCQCGCGQKTNIAPQTDRIYGWIKGEPISFIAGHQSVLSPVEYIEEDRGYKTPCWIWQRSKTPANYGCKLIKGKMFGAHRYMYLKVKGPNSIPKGLELDHLCRVHDCVNPDHLEPVTRAVNLRRGSGAKLTDDQVREIRRLRNEGMSYADIARRFPVRWQTCRMICLRKKWADLA